MYQLIILSMRSHKSLENLLAACTCCKSKTFLLVWEGVRREISLVPVDASD